MYKVPGSFHFPPGKQALVSRKEYMTEKICRNVKCASISALENIRSPSNPITHYSSPPGRCISHASQECLSFIKPLAELTN